MNLKMKVLVHTCCAPCLTYPLRELQSDESEVVSFFYNPNIQPYLEYERRRDCAAHYCEGQGISFIESNYEMERYFRDVAYREEMRCSICYSLRLTETAKYAKKGNFDAFTTTMLVSPYQKHDLINELGHSIGSEYEVSFYYKDFRKGWKDTISISREHNLYRQKYCGCVYSEKERYHKDNKATGKRRNGEKR